MTPLSLLVGTIVLRVQQWCSLHDGNYRMLAFSPKYEAFFHFPQNFRNTIRESNSLGPDQARQNVGPDLDRNCLQRISAEGTSNQRELVKAVAQL